MAIRITKRDRDKLYRIYGKSNKARQKYNRLRRQGVAESQLPLVPTSAKQLIQFAKQTNMSRKDFNKIVDDLMNFSKRQNPDYIFKTNKHGVAYSLSYEREAIKKTQSAQKAKEEHYRELLEQSVEAPTENSIVTPAVLQEFGADLPIKPIQDFNPDSITSSYALDSYLENIGKQNEEYFTQRDYLYFENFRTAMYTIFNSEADRIVHLLDEMGIENFMLAYVNKFLSMNLDYIYDESMVQGKAEETYSKIARAFSEITGDEVPQYSPRGQQLTINSETGEIVND